MFSQAFAEQAQKGGVAVVGTATAAVTDNPLIAIATLVYIVIQAGYLLRKWWREEKDWVKSRRRRRDDVDSERPPL